MATIPVGNGPDGIAIDAATHTAYVANANDDTVSVIDTATCDAQTQATCGQVPATTSVGAYPQQLTIDDATQTVYVDDLNGNALSLIDVAKCNALVTSGCAAAAPSRAGARAPVGHCAGSRAAAGSTSTASRTPT